MPENSISGFIKAVDLGVTTLELDLSVTKDGQLLVSHEPYFSPEFCADTTGYRVKEDSIINIYALTYDEVQQFDCGSLQHARFPDQEKLRTTKPLLVDVLDSVERYIERNKLASVNYNVELKTQKQSDSVFHPVPAEFSDMVFELITAKGLWGKVNIQSFDLRTLKYFNEKYPDVRLALLIENDLGWKKNLEFLGFIPEIYSCDYALLTPEAVEEMQEEGMKVIPWTVNETSDMQQLIEWGVDGIITDYPDRLIRLVN